MPLPEYSQEELWSLYKKLPEDLRYAIFAPETATNIDKIAGRYDIEQVSELARYVGRVLMGLLPPPEFKKLISKDLDADENTARKIFQEINAFIFYPVRESLNHLYETTIEAPQPTPTSSPEKRERKGEDFYRESFEEKTEEKPMSTGPVRKKGVKLGEEKSPSPAQKEADTPPQEEKQAPEKRSGEDKYREPIE